MWDVLSHSDRLLSYPWGFPADGSGLPPPRGEWGHFSAWKYKRKKKPPLEFMIPDLETDIIDVNNGMDMIDESLDKVNVKEKYITEGNHDNWTNMSWKTSNNLFSQHEKYKIIDLFSLYFFFCDVIFVLYSEYGSWHNSRYNSRSCKGAI